MPLAAADLMRDPAWMPARISINEDLLEFVSTEQDLLRAASFLDGRTRFDTGLPVHAQLSQLAAGFPGREPDRILFHIAFCGSTLLSRLIDSPGRSMVLREPQCLTDLAVSRAAADQAGRSDPRIGSALHLARFLLRRRWRADEPVAIKPTNWINNIAPEICADPRPLHALFLTMPREAFLQAVFRGGSGRLAFAARAAVHLSTRGTAGAGLVAAALAASREIDKLARLASVTHRLQITLFAEAAHAAQLGPDHWMTLAEVVADPASAARRAAALLALDVPGGAIERNCARWATCNAKQPERPFSADLERSGDAGVRKQHGAAIAGALAWAETALGPDRIP